MATSELVKLYRSPDMPGHWIGQDKAGGLVVWPARKGGWADRTPYTGPRRHLAQALPAEARGSGWPGAGGGRPPRAAGQASGMVGIRVTNEERAAWEEAAEPRTLTEWARDELNEAAARKKRERGGPAR